MNKHNIQCFLLWPLWTLGIIVLAQMFVSKHGNYVEDVLAISGGCLAISIVGIFLHGKVDLKESKWVFSIVLLLLLMFAGKVWPTVYFYEHSSLAENYNVLVRVNRITGKIDYYTRNGWNESK